MRRSTADEAILLAQLSHALAEHPDAKGVASFAFLFVVVWWAWFNGAMYHDQHGNDDIRTRVFTFLQMIAVAGMAVFAGDALGSQAVGFALSYTAFHLILTWLWWRAGTYLPAHRPITGPYAITFLLTSALFAASVLVAAPTRFVLWGLALATDLFTLLVTMKRIVAARRDRHDPPIDRTGPTTGWVYLHVEDSGW